MFPDDYDGVIAGAAAQWWQVSRVFTFPSRSAADVLLLFPPPIHPRPYFLRPSRLPLHSTSTLKRTASTPSSTRRPRPTSSTSPTT